MSCAFGECAFTSCALCTRDVFWIMRRRIARRPLQPITDLLRIGRYGRGGGVGRGLGVGTDLGVGVTVAVGVGVEVAVGVAVAVGVGVGVGVPPPPGAWSPTIIGEPVLKKPTVALALCGG